MSRSRAFPSVSRGGLQERFSHVGSQLKTCLSDCQVHRREIQKHDGSQLKTFDLVMTRHDGMRVVKFYQASFLGFQFPTAR